jgi:hypothetical protein
MLRGANEAAPVEEGLMPTITIARRFCGPPNSGNGGYVCGLIAGHVGGCAEITLRAPPPLDRSLEIVAAADGAAELRERETVLATGRRARLDVADVPTPSFAEAEDAVRRTPYDECSHKLSTCFVCGPARAPGDGLRIFAGPLAARGDQDGKTFAATWVPYPDLAGDDGCVAPEFVWASMDCPSGYAGLGAGPLGMSGGETILLGRMAARIDRRPKPGDRCVVVAWPTGRDGRKVFAGSALLGANREILAVAQATWLIVERQVQLGQG